MAEWTADTVAERFAEAAETARRLPPMRRWSPGVSLAIGQRRGGGGKTRSGQ